MKKYQIYRKFEANCCDWKWDLWEIQLTWCVGLLRDWVVNNWDWRNGINEE